ncbi:alpha/beta hydrolase family protein [Methylopila musalis]|uniref:Alpha/beta hydrolase family protein n=1 Tax=Methylopila musalis TaxID=1134781 RepID=A0ABW3Z2G3_9HYPH
MKTQILTSLRAVSVALALSVGVTSLCVATAHAQQAIQSLPLAGLEFELFDTWSVEKLNSILSQDFPKFAGIDVAYTPAQNAVRLYRVSYDSVVPEQGNRPIRTSGLIAIPDVAATTLPLVSYQHGTVYGKEEVPSTPEHSPETQLMIAQFAAQGYIVIGADYFGMGTSSEPEGYMVKASHQQATVDMLFAAQPIIKELGFATDDLFLAGWSQGGFVTTALLEKLEEIGVPVAAAATASAPIDLAAEMNGILYFPREIDAAWIGTTFILSSFAFENYYNVPGLAASLIKPEHYEVARAAYMREPFDVADVPTTLEDLLRPEYFEPNYFKSSTYGRLMADTQAYRRVITVPMRNYYGDTDEAIPVGVARLAMTYQQSLGSGNNIVEAISTGETDHRGTYAKAVPEWKIWFDTLSE